MMYLLLLASAGVALATKCGHKNVHDYKPITRTYCLALEDVDWDYGVASFDEENDRDKEDDAVPPYDLTGNFEDYAEYQLSEDKPKLGKYAKRGILRSYVVNEDGSCRWGSRLYSDNEARDGILGPTIRGVVGDTINVRFKNYATIVYVDSVEVDDGDDDEAFLTDATFNIVPTGLSYNHRLAVGYEGYRYYAWTVGQSAHTGHSSTTVWTYRSDAVENNGIEKDGYEFGYDSGVFGPIVIADPAYIMNDDQKSRAFPCDIDEEVNLAFLETSESNSIYYKWNLHDFFGKEYHDKYRENAEYAIPNTKRSINGHMYGNLAASTGMKFDYGKKLRFNMIVQNTTVRYTQDEDEHADEHQQEEGYLWGPNHGWSNITVDMGHEMGGSKVHTFDGQSSQTLDYHCLTSGTVMIDVNYFNRYGVSAYFTTKEDDGTYVPDAEPDTGLSTTGKVVGIVFACAFILMFAGLVVYGRDAIFKSNAYSTCMDDSQPEVVELNIVAKSNDV